MPSSGPVPVTSASWESRGLFVDEWAHVELSDAGASPIPPAPSADPAPGNTETNYSKSEGVSLLRYGPPIFPAAVALEVDAVTFVARSFRELTTSLPTSSEPLEVRMRLLLRDVIDLKVYTDISRSTPVHLRSKGLVAAELVMIYYTSSRGGISSVSIYSSMPRLSHTLRCLVKQSLVCRCIGLDICADRDPSSYHQHISTAISLPPSAAQEYYDEVILSLKCAPSRAEIASILDEFAAECKASLELKRISLRDKNLLFAIHDICNNCLFLSPRHRGDNSMCAAGPWASCLDLMSADWLDVGVPEEIRDAATLELRERVFVYRAALNVLVCVLFGTDAIVIRQRIVDGPKPLTITSWVELLMHDVYTMVTQRLSFREPHASADAVEKELGNTLRSSFDSGMSMSLRMGDLNRVSNSMSLSLSDTLRSSGSSTTLASRSLLSTSKRLASRLRQQVFFQAERSNEIIRARQSIQDMQIVLLSIFADISLFKSFALHARVSVSGADDGVAMHSDIKSRARSLPSADSGEGKAAGDFIVRFDTVRGNPSLIDTVGSAFFSCPSGSYTIEVILNRFSILMEEFSSSPNVKTEVRNIHERFLSKAVTLRERAQALKDQSTSQTKLSKLGSSNKTGSDRLNTSAPPPLDTLSVTADAKAGSEKPMQQGGSGEAQTATTAAPWLGYVPVPASPMGKQRRDKPDISFSLEDGDSGSNSALKKLLVSSRLGRNGGDSNKENHADKSAGCVAAVAVPCSHDYELSNDRPSDEWMCFLETKEVLIFFCVDALRSLVFDSVDVSRTVQHEHWQEVVAARSAMRYLFPLASGQMNVDLKDLQSTVVAEGAADSKASVGKQPSSSTINAPGSQLKSEDKADAKSQTSALTTTSSSSSGAKGLFWGRGILDSLRCSAPQGEAGAPLQPGDKSAANSLPVVGANNDDTLLLESDKVVKSPSQRDLVEFGAPRYGLSPSTWTLLLNAYLNIEELAEKY